jgi:alpha-beta hydrolase superfamily lysophospholipase
LNFCNKTYQNLKKEKPDAEIVVLGHSLGAVIACNLDLDTNDKLILSVPGFKGAQETFSLSYTFKVMFKLALDKLTGKISKVELPSSQESGHITDNDPYKVTKVSPNLLFQILRLNERTREQVAFLQNPLLVLKIAGDRVVDNETIDAYFEVMPSVFKQKITSDYQDHDWIWVPEAVNEIAPEILNFARTRIAKP